MALPLAAVADAASTAARTSERWRPPGPPRRDQRAGAGVDEADLVKTDGR
jgi:hypothetical protein